MPARAWVSTSSVTKTLVTPSRCISGTDALSIIAPQYSIEPYAVMPIPSRHVRQNHLISDLQPVQNFDGIHGATAQFHRDALRSFAIWIHLEQLNRAVGLSEYRATYVYYITQVLEFDRAVHAQVRHRAWGQCAGQPGVNGSCSVDDRGIDPRNLPGDYAIACVDLRILTDHDVVRLSLRNL